MSTLNAFSTQPISSNPSVTEASNLNMIPEVAGRRAFPTRGLRNADPFLMLDHIGPGTVKPNWKLDGGMHPHRGFETVSIFFDGQLDHVDSRGNQVRIGPGDVQVMNAGSGILHGGAMQANPKTGQFHEFQLWVNVPAALKMREPTVQSVKSQDIPSVKRDGSLVRVLSGQYAGFKGPAQTTVPTTLLHAKLEAGASMNDFHLAGGYRGLIYMMSGHVHSQGVSIKQGQTLDLGVAPPDGQQMKLLSEPAPTEMLILTGQVIGEPVVFGGPFVMNTQAEIQRAYEDFHDSKFEHL